jgi:TRAP-type C4-dicarboxylate transport system substrate-binding protein
MSQVSRRTFGAMLGAGAAALASGLELKGAHAAEIIKVGTLAPQQSPWGKVFQVWQEAVKTKTKGALELQFFYNGQQGDEGAMVGKMKAGQLDAAAVTAVGLSKIHKPILALQLPGVHRTWEALDKARDAMKGDFEKGAEGAGFQILGWGDVGQAHLMSVGAGNEVKKPSDLAGKKPYMWRDDSIAPVLFQVIGGVTPVPLNVPEVLPNLNTGAINVITAPALAAEQLQWAPKITNIHEQVAGCAIGALVISSKRLASLAPELKTALIETGAKAGAALTKTIRNEDKAAFDRIKGKAKVINLSKDEMAAWDQVFKETRKRLGQGTFDPKLIATLEKMAGV